MSPVVRPALSGVSTDSVARHGARTGGYCVVDTELRAREVSKMTEVIWVWTIEFCESGPPPDITGWDVVARDGDIATVDEATYETGSGCIIINTGRWIFGKRRMLPAGLVNNVDVDGIHGVFGWSCAKKEVKACA